MGFYENGMEENEGQWGEAQKYNQSMYTYTYVQFMKEWIIK